MLKFLKRLPKRLYNFLATGWFFGITIGVFVFQSLWIVFSASFPLPFDEQFHIGLIDLYSHQWTPFISHQPDSAAIFGDATRSTSYIFHYIFSFPYRVITLFTDNFVAQVIIFRIFNIGLFVLGLFLFRKLLIKLGLSKRLTQVVLLCFIMVPIVPLLAATINYDNLLFVLVAANLLVAIDVLKSKKLNAKQVMLVLALPLLTCLVKYTFVPVAAIIYLFVAHSLLKSHGKKLFSKFKQSFQKLSNVWRISLVALVLLSAGLFIERYVYNAVQYRSLQPDCIAVQPFDVCKHWSPWARDNIIYKERYKDWQAEGPVKFTKVWAPKMINDAFVAFTYLRVDPMSLHGTLGRVVTKEALSIPKAVAKIVFTVGVVLVILNVGKLWNDKAWRLVFFSILATAVLLWIKNYGDYRELKHITAIQPRYLLILAPLALGAIAQAYDRLIRSRKIKAAMLTIVFLALLQGGGVTIYILRSYSAWYWPNQFVVRMNTTARDFLLHFTIMR